MFTLPYQIVLGSQSPRRIQLLKGLQINFTTWISNVEESFSADLKAQEIPLFLSKKKAEAYLFKNDKTLLITADTIVWVNNHVLNKPANLSEAKQMLLELSGNVHQVFTAVCLKTNKKEKQFYCKTNVYFKSLTEQEIDFYLQNFNPLDKAGAYGAQEWIGYIGIDKLEGSYFNVMGLPTAELYKALNEF
ncbi:MAG: septum formation protein Maf [Bacteroidia bacterium]|nr:septum formation protein Maf [Bacteroidia bacterium]